MKRIFLFLKKCDYFCGTEGVLFSGSGCGKGYAGVGRNARIWWLDKWAASVI